MTTTTLSPILRSSRIARTFARTVVLAASLVAGVVPAAAQQWSWPERAEDLRELPADLPPERLSAVMRGFTSALGVRCFHCHVGEEGTPLSSYDFVSDANPNKGRARAMLRLLGAVNDHLDEIEPSGVPVNMRCHTCHQGKPRPQTLAEALTERWEAEGGDETLAYFRDLRARYYGAGAYDFTPASVAGVAGELLQRSDTTSAIRMLEMNVDDHPTSAGAQEALGTRCWRRATRREPERPTSGPWSWRPRAHASDRSWSVPVDGYSKM